MKIQPLSPEAQQRLLDRRTTPQMVGRFGSFASLLYALDNLPLHTDSERINDMGLASPFPENYEPTRRELFDAIARQTGSRWAYDGERGFWVFAEPPMPPPYTLDLAEGWRVEDRGIYTFYGPPDAPVGMDIYTLGGYSADDPGAERRLYDRVRERLSLRTARRFAPDATADMMERVRVGPHEALFFEQPQTPGGAAWRQWAIVDEGQAVLVVSAVRPEHQTAVLPDVRAMVESFRLKPRAADADAGVGGSNGDGAGGVQRTESR